MKLKIIPSVLSSIPVVYGCVVYLENQASFVFYNDINFLQIIVLELISLVVLAPIIEEFVFRGIFIKKGIFKLASVFTIVILGISVLKVLGQSFFQNIPTYLYNYFLLNGFINIENNYLYITVIEGYSILLSIGVLYLLTLLLFKMLSIKINLNHVISKKKLIVLSIISSLIFLEYHGNLISQFKFKEFILLSIASIFFILLQIRYNMTAAILGHATLNLIGISLLIIFSRTSPFFLNLILILINILLLYSFGKKMSLKEDKLTNEHS